MAGQDSIQNHENNQMQLISSNFGRIIEHIQSVRDNMKKELAV